MSNVIDHDTQQAVKEIEKISDGIQDYHAPSIPEVINSDEESVSLQADLKAASKRLREIEARHKEVTKPVTDAANNLKSELASSRAPLYNYIQKLKSLISEYETEQRKLREQQAAKAAAESEKLMANAEKKAEKQMDSGNFAAASKTIMDASSKAAAAAPMKRNAQLRGKGRGNSVGMSDKVDNLEVVMLKLVLRQVLEGHLPESILKIDVTKLKKHIKDSGFQPIPGVTFTKGVSIKA